MDNIDIAGLVEDGILDLDDVFAAADWVNDGEAVDTFVRRVFGPQGDEPGVMYVRILSATSYGLVGYRWSEEDDDGAYEEGPIRLDREQAVQDGIKYARDHDES